MIRLLVCRLAVIACGLPVILVVGATDFLTCILTHRRTDTLGSVTNGLIIDFDLSRFARNVLRKRLRGGRGRKRGRRGNVVAVNGWIHERSRKTLFCN